jgi:hypothetical protein
MMTIDPNNEPLPVWEQMQGRVQPTRSSLTVWSWYDLTRSLAAGMGGGALAALVAVWLPPGNLAHPEYLVRLGSLLIMLLAWGLPLLATLCLVEGHLALAPRAWARKLGWAAVTLVVTGVPLAVVLAVPVSTAPFLRDHPVWMPIITWCAFGVAVGNGLGAGFARERHREQTIAAGALAGCLAGGLTPYVAAAVTGLPPLLAGLARHAAELVPAGLLMGFAQASVREVLKTAWLQVLYGEQAGRHYPLYDTPLTLGTDPENTVVLDAAGRVQPVHATIRRTDEGVRLETGDEEALVFRHDRRITVCELYDGDEIQIGETMVRYYQIP